MISNEFEVISMISIATSNEFHRANALLEHHAMSKVMSEGVIDFESISVISIV